MHLMEINSRRCRALGRIGGGLLALMPLALIPPVHAEITQISPEADHFTGAGELVTEAPATPPWLAPSIAASAVEIMAGKTASGAPEIAARYSLEGDFSQGGLVRGRAEPGTEVIFEDETVAVSEEGYFLFGFARDHAGSAVIALIFPDGTRHDEILMVADRSFPVQRIDNIDQSKVSGFTPAQLAHIERSTAKKNEARKSSIAEPLWRSDFDWPVTGRISGVFGAQRILNGEPQRFHSGFDIAAPSGTPILAPADGIITLAETDMYFEGGLVLIDHGQQLESALMHMSKVTAEAGRRVTKGEVIGEVGATGRATGPHLHWSLKWRRTLLDARRVLGEMPVPAASSNIVD